MTCPHCGTDTPTGAARCSACGAPQGPTARPTPPDLDVTGAIPGTLGSAVDPTVAGGDFETVGGATPSFATGTHQLGFDATRIAVPAAGKPAAGAQTGSTTGGTPRAFAMLNPGETLGARYHIIRLLGVGGMGAVYHAWDAELGVAVALKVIRGDITGDPDAAAAVERQFKRELLLARQVTHKHVVRIHDLGDIDGIKYITMPYVQGADLATILKKEGVLPIPRTLRYITQIVGGLVAAHEAGVVHRDLKPANIMIDEDDSALIMDFGIAHSSTAAGTGAEKVVGTLAYMAPEQAQAKATDQRADVYALGMMLREMLIGKKPSSDGQQALADLMARIKDAPPRLRTINETIPEPLDDLAARCVEPDPANRFQSSAELAAALAALDEQGQLRPIEKPVMSPWRMTVAAVVVIATLGGAAIVWRRTVPAAAPKPIDPVSILVADFDNKTGDQVFDGALEQPLTMEMETAPFIQALPRDNAKQQAQAINGATRLDDATARLIAFRQSTGARATYVLAGSVYPKERGYTLELRALDPSNGTVLKAVSADAKTKADVLSAVSTLAGRLRSALGDKTVNASKAKPNETFTAGSLEAFREYTTAQELQQGRHDADAVPHYRRAIELDPKFGRSYSGLAISEQRLGHNEEADAAFKTALSLTDRMTDREKYRTFGGYYLGVTKNYEKAAEQFSALVAAYPADDAGFGNLGLTNFYLRDFTKAMDGAKHALAMNPKNILQRNNLALYAMYAGDFATASAEAKKVIADKGATESTYLPLVMEAVAKGDMAAAGAAYQEMATKTGALGASLASLGRADLALYSGRLEAAASELQSGLTADIAAKNTGFAALKQVALAEELVEAGRRPQAAAAAQQALARSRNLNIIVSAARVLIRSGKIAEARTLASELEQQLQKQNRAYGKILLAEIAIEDKKYADAIDLLTQARQLADVWLGHFDLGLAYAMAGSPAEAKTEFDVCQKRRGEATALFFDERPTVRLLAPLPYWMGRAEEGLQMPTAASRYQAFIDLRKDATADPLVQDARRRIK